MLRESRSQGFKEKVKHMTMEEYLERDFDSNFKDSGSTSKTTDFEENGYILRDKNKEESVVWPSMAVVANIPFEHEDDSYLDDGFLGDIAKDLKDEWIKQGYKPLKVYPLWSWLGHSGFAVVKFGEKWDGFNNAKMFVKDFEVDKHGRKDWYDETRGKDDKFYAWIANDEDYYSNGLVGGFLRKNGALKTLSSTEIENEVKNLKLILGLETLLEEMSKRSKEIQSTTNSYMASVMKQIENFNKDLIKMQEKTNKMIEHVEIKTQHEDHEKKMNELAMLEQKKAYDRLLKLSYDDKRDKENIEKKIVENEQEINQMKGDMDMMSDEIVEAKKKIESIQKDVEEKEKEIKDLKELNQALIVKDQWNNERMTDTEEDLISGLEEIYDDHPPVHNSVKRKMEELDAKCVGITRVVEYDPIDGWLTKELWNQKEGRKATLREGVNFILKQLKTEKQKNRG